MANIADGAVCTVAGIGGTTAGSCTTATSCCATYAATASGAAVASKLICFPLNTKKAVSYTVTALDADTGLTSKAAFPIADCAAATTGASTLAVSAAALATAVYMM